MEVIRNATGMRILGDGGGLIRLGDALMIGARHGTAISSDRDVMISSPILKRSRFWAWTRTHSLLQGLEVFWQFECSFGFWARWSHISFASRGSHVLEEGRGQESGFCVRLKVNENTPHYYIPRATIPCTMLGTRARNLIVLSVRR